MPRHRPPLIAIALLLLGLGSAAQAQLDLRRMLSRDARNLLPGGEILQKGNCEKLKRWVETPAGEPAPGAMGRLARSAGPGLRLISDEVFVPAFGKPYDQLTQADLSAYQRETLPACQKIGLFTPAQAQQVQQLLNPGAHPAYSQQLVQQRAQARVLAEARAAALQEMGQLRAELGQLPATDAGLSRLQQLDQRAAQLRDKLPAQESTAFDSAAQQARQRIAGPAQQERIARALAEPQEPASLARLQQVEASLDKNLLPPGDAQLARLQERIHALSLSTAAALRAEVAALPAGIEGLASGAEWSARTQSLWRNGGSLTPEIRAVMSDFNQQRSRTLASPTTAAAFKAAVNATRTPGEAQALPARYLMSDEGNTAAGQALQQAVNDRLALMERNAALGRSLDAPPRKTQTVAAAADDDEEDDAPPPPKAKGKSAGKSRETLRRGEPSEEMMFDLVNQRFTDKADNYRDIQQRCSQGPAGGGNGMGAAMDSVMCLSVMMTGAVTGNAMAEAPKITKFKKLGCERASGKPGYICDYKITTSHPINQQMGSILGGLMGRGGVGQARFLYDGDGWIAFFSSAD